MDEIATDVKSNIQSLFKRGEKFEILDSKSEELKTSSKSLYKRARQVRIQETSVGKFVAPLMMFACLMTLFLLLSLNDHWVRV